MRKVSGVLIYIGFLALFSGFLFALLRFRDIAHILLIAGTIALLLNLLMIPFLPKRKLQSKQFYTYNKDWHNIRAIFNISGITGAICLYIGMLLKDFHIGSSVYFVYTGTCLILLAMLILVYLIYKKKSYLIEPPQAISLTSQELDQYIGVYSNKQLNKKMFITKNENETSLIAQLTGQSTFPLSTVKRHVFNYIVYRVVLEFKPEEREFILIQHGGYFPFIKEITQLQ